MPKLKTHSGTSKRFRRVANGGFKRRRAFRNHILTKKSTKRKRQLRVNDLHVKKVDIKAIDRLMRGS